MIQNKYGIFYEIFQFLYVCRAKRVSQSCVTELCGAFIVYRTWGSNLDSNSTPIWCSFSGFTRVQWTISMHNYIRFSYILHWLLVMCCLMLCIYLSLDAHRSTIFYLLIAQSPLATSISPKCCTLVAEIVFRASAELYQFNSTEFLNRSMRNRRRIVMSSLYFIIKSDYRWSSRRVKGSFCLTSFHIHFW